MTMHKASHSRDDIDRLTVRRKYEGKDGGKDGEKGLPNIENSVDTSIRQLEDYIKKKTTPND